MPHKTSNFEKEIEIQELPDVTEVKFINNLPSTH